MKASVVEEIGKQLVVHSGWPEPECEIVDAIIRVEANGICRSDYHVWQGGFPWAGMATSVPVVLGHEYCGVVEHVGADVARFRAGDRVVVPFNHACGKCELCLAGHQNVCLDLRVPMAHYGGGFSRYARVARADVNLVRCRNRSRSWTPRVRLRRRRSRRRRNFDRTRGKRYRDFTYPR